MKQSGKFSSGSILLPLTLILFILTGFKFAGDKINTIKVGKQVWMVDYLNTDHFQNGDLIPEANSDEEWKKAAMNHTPAWCYYDQNKENEKKYGKLYNWYAVTDPRGIAPKGFHIPKWDELNQMIKYFGDFNQFTWDSVSKIYKCNPYHKIDFVSLSGGGRGGTIQSGETQFRDMNKTATWWSSNEYDMSALGKNYAGKYAAACSFYTKLVPDRDKIPRVVTNNEILPYMKDNGYSVRCIKN